MVRTMQFSAATMARFTHQAAAIQIQFGSDSVVLPLASLDLAATSSDERIRHAVAMRLLVLPAQLDDHVIDRPPGGQLTLRPKSDGG